MPKQPTATLTDVKNKIGEVFTLVDEHGELVVTSYGKPKYTIKRLSTTARKQAAQELATQEEPAEVKEEAPQVKEKQEIKPVKLEIEPERVEKKAPPPVEAKAVVVEKKIEPTPTPVTPAAKPVPEQKAIPVEKSTFKQDETLDVVFAEVDSLATPETPRPLQANQQPVRVNQVSHRNGEWERSNSLEISWVQKAKDLI